nr:cytosolic sulfotransferase 2-like [Salvelinus alpinus]
MTVYVSPICIPLLGTTWVSYILDLLYFGQRDPEHQRPIFEKVPFLELLIPLYPPGVGGAGQLNHLSSPHQDSPPSSVASQVLLGAELQEVYVARNAKDSAVSYFHFDRMNQTQPEPGDWNNFLQRFMDGKSE